MSLSDLASIATIVQGVFVIISLGFVWYQLRETVRLTRAANAQRLIELASPFNLQLIQDREMAKLWIGGAKEYDTMDEIEKDRYRNLLIWWLLLHENIYHQKEKNLIDDQTYNAWDRDLRKFIASQQVGRYWMTMNDTFEASFVEHVSQILAEQPTKKRSS